jgi:hypothetical protein
MIRYFCSNIVNLSYISNNKYKITNIIVQNQTIPHEKINKKDNPRSHNNKHNKISIKHNQSLI